MNGSREKRRIQRIRPDYAVIGQVPTGNVVLADLSVVGARVDHQFPLAAGRRIRLDFSCEGESVSLLCEVTRCRLQRDRDGVVYSSGLRFIDVTDDAAASLRRVISAFVSRHLAQRKARRRQEVAFQAQSALV